MLHSSALSPPAKLVSESLFIFTHEQKNTVSDSESERERERESGVWW
jgi:hypothetical protein